MVLNLVPWIFALLASVAWGELLQNGGFESLAHWDCWEIHCSLSDVKHSGHHGLQVQGRHEAWQGPSQYIHVVSGHTYNVSGYIKLLNDQPGHDGQNVRMTVDVHFSDNTDDYVRAASHSNVKASDGWIHLKGSFVVPHHNNTHIRRTRIYYSGPDPSVNFVVDDASVTEQGGGSSAGHTSSDPTAHVINQIRKSNIHFNVTTGAHTNKAEVQIHILQTKKSFPFGMMAKAPQYNANAANGKYRDFIHKHFNWGVTGNALKWYSIERHRGQVNYQPALDTVNGLRSHGIKVRGHNLVWSVDRYVQDWVKQLHGDELRNAVKHHIEETMNVTRGLLEHWDVNNENLHGHWYQNQLHDPDYNLELFRIAHHADPNVKLFLNDYSVVSSGSSTDAYLQQANHFKAANVGLYGLGAQCHFPGEKAPDPDAIKQRLDKLAQAGLPIWVTELDCVAADENRRADFYEKALRALYGHPAVEGILFWGFWDKNHWRGPHAAIATGDNVEPNAAGRRVLDLLENQWMTDETHVLSQSGDQFTVRGFHGDYEVHVIYQGHELDNLKKTFTLGKGPHTVNMNVHT